MKLLIVSPLTCLDHEHEILDFVPKRPKLIAEPERHYRGRTTYSMVHFKCQFDLPKTNEQYYYRIEWIASDFGKPQRRFNVSKAVQADKLKTLELTEALFSRHKLHMGMNVSIVARGENIQFIASERVI